MKKNEQKRKGFTLFGLFNRDGRGVDKDEMIGPPNLKNFFKTYFRKFGKLLSVNLIMIFTLPSLLLLLFHASSMLLNFHPVFGVIYAVVTSALGIPVTVSTSEMIGPVYGMYIASGVAGAEGVQGGSIVLSEMLKIFGTTTDMPTFSALYWAVIAVLVLFTAITWGWQNVSAAYITRNLFRGEPVFVVSDYFHAIKKNMKQGLLFGMFDAFVIFVLTTNFCFFLTTPGMTFGADMLFILNIGIFILYLVMRKYIYLMMVTFDISVLKMLKNALILATLGLKRNVMAILGKIVIISLNFALVFLLPLNMIAIPLVLPLIYYFATSAYISSYAYYPVIQKYMINSNES